MRAATMGLRIRRTPTRKGAKSGDLQAWGRSNGITELAIPRDIREVDALPVLGTGKLDYVTMGALAVA
ncbi:Long-chain-fatty-acid--[acyl-carrier-protein] ligase [Sphingobium chlorophenolicum]|uniref:Long-chain-fatty-acid--[acyl-carrier-protein] ligase n=2 Tax=Sphingobium chlorophenolicum TaxID=46429 RepID=A0A081RB52_SPHCR|nr:Long-chain-fatty-acid--[acyl-carrier-protein] ligase [Sphingobium chlorophenolicum]